MIRSEIADIQEIDIYANNYFVEINFTDEGGNKSVLEMSRYGAELLLRNLMEALNKIERRP